jgi:hypothetical protein
MTMFDRLNEAADAIRHERDAEAAAIQAEQDARNANAAETLRVLLATLFDAPGLTARIDHATPLGIIRVHLAEPDADRGLTIEIDTRWWQEIPEFGMSGFDHYPRLYRECAAKPWCKSPTDLAVFQYETVAGWAYAWAETPDCGGGHDEPF